MFKKKIGFILAMILLVHSSFLLAAPAKNPPRLWVSIVRSEFLNLGAFMYKVIPLAMWKDGQWSSSWPSPNQYQDNEYQAKIKKISDIPAEWFGGQKISSQWVVWSSSGVAQGIKITGVTKSIHCGGLWALSTNLPITPSLGWSGLAINDPNQKLNSLQPIDPVLDQSKKIEEFVRSAYTEKENNSLRQWYQNLYPGDPLVQGSETADELYQGLGDFYAFRGLPFNVKHSAKGIPLTTPEREKFPILISELKKTESLILGRTIVRFVAGRSYPVNPDEKNRTCPVQTEFIGWLSIDSAGMIKIIQSNFHFPSCNKQENSSFRPYGFLQLDQSLFLFGSRTVLDSEVYMIFDLDPNSFKAKKITYFQSGGC